MRVLGAISGAILVAVMTVSVAQTLVIPRGRVGLLRLVDRVVDSFFGAVGARLGTYDQRNAWRSSQPAALMGGLLAVWISSFMLGFALLLWPDEPSFGAALRESGSSMFTLGFAARAGARPTVIDFLAAAAGLLLVALQISYLPTLYSAYNRRETELTLLAARAGEPAWGPEILVRTRFVATRDDLPGFYAAWERWAADVAESHSSYPALMRFRSPDRHTSWLIGLLAVLDSAAMYLAVSPDLAPIQARLCLRMGIRCLRELATTVGINVNDDPMPHDPILLSFEEFAAGCDRLRAAGFPVERPALEAWPHFQGWRVNYEDPAYKLAYGIDAVPALWSGGRRNTGEPIAPKRPANRTPDHPEGADPKKSLDRSPRRPETATDPGSSPRG